MTDDEYGLIEASFSASWPQLDKFMASSKLTLQERMVCILTFMGFRSKEISVLTGKSAQRTANIKNVVNEKLFGKGNARNLKENLENKYGIDL